MQYRLGPRRYGVYSHGDIVRLSEDSRNCVVFLGWQKAGPIDDAPIDPKGTGFLVWTPSAPDSMFLVTARHVAEKLHTPFVVRYNHKDGNARLLHVHTPAEARWCFHEDSQVDLAVMPLDLPSGFVGTGHELESLIDPARSPAIWKEIVAGDMVNVVGLFHFRHGDKANLPIVHTGHVAMLPGDEPIPVDGKLVEGYLVQANAISGCSGSPVFVAPWMTLRFQEKDLLVGLPTKAHLMGVWSSSWKVEQSQIVSVRTDDDDKGTTAAPLGMGIVTPAYQLVPIFQGEKMKQAYESMMNAKLARRSPTHDAVPDAPPASDENPLPNVSAAYFGGS
jgi:hypothetical protein